MSNACIQAHLPVFVPVTPSRHRNIHPFMVHFHSATSFSRCHSRSVASQGLIKVISGKKASFYPGCSPSRVFPGIASRGSFPDPLTQEVPPYYSSVRLPRKIKNHCEYVFSIITVLRTSAEFPRLFSMFSVAITSAANPRSARLETSCPTRAQRRS
ncbi:uncharacterized protein BT62DRAFT_1002244 [Guyanagaster necrorhizus]|uniref:Uncharacterized protein n=1 Tax=Guyanagaster necrorhizus TaxID=856835 RepID=A0A9P7VYI6_9AGAR|nr:uncharacterized protein BT62DRAFT_1002244 [Guyanagaster necrorhizus MCA 3950]KAG7449926.1 hypothetical protein BT62DRAFT_1002244 [Guyanagaster necrorhizus MCA 3950]